MGSLNENAQLIADIMTAFAEKPRQRPPSITEYAQDLSAKGVLSTAALTDDKLEQLISMFYGSGRWMDMRKHLAAIAKRGE